MPNNQIKKNDTDLLPVLNSLRGIAAIMIMIHHITVYLLPRISVYSQQVTPFFRKNYLWVDFFFILSGFIACHVYQKHFAEKISFKDYSGFIISRFARLYPLHFIVLALFVIMEFVYLYFYQIDSLAIKYTQLPIPFDSEFSEKALFLGVTMLNAIPKWGTWNGPSWAMSAIWIIAFIVPFLIKIFYNIKLFWNAVVLVGCYTILFVLLKREGTLDIMAAGGLIRCLMETLIGIACYNIYRIFPSNRVVTSNYMLGFCLLMTFISMLLHINHIVTVIIFFVLILVAAYHNNDSLFSNPYLLLLGDLSFSIYIIHWLPLKSLDKIALVTTGTKLNSIDPSVLVTLSIFFTVILIMYSSYWAYNNLEKPLRIYVKKKLMSIIN